MAIPDFQTVMLPLLEFYGDGKEHSVHEANNALAKALRLTEGELSELLPSGKQTTFYNRVGWGRTYLTKSGLLMMSRRSYYRITPRGLQVLGEKPQRIDMKYLEKFAEYIAFRDTTPKAHENGTAQTMLEDRTPEEVLEYAFQEIRTTVAQDLLATVKGCSAAFFERLVVDLLVKMGYGGSRKEAARAVGQVGDGGIDGVIDEDRLGLDAVYIQAKRWEGVVGRPEIQKFVGALMGRKARKGIFITTSAFTQDAMSYVLNIDFRVVLIDGERLANLMIDYEVGVAETTTYRLKRVDSDYFANS